MLLVPRSSDVSALSDPRSQKCTRRYAFRTATEGGGSMQQRVCGANSTLSSVHGGTLLNSGRAEADILFSVCFQVCGSFGAGAEKPASDGAGTGKRLEPETGFCASKKPPKY